MRKIVQVATLPPLVYDDTAKHTREVTPPATVALCDDGTLWLMQHRIDGKPAAWSRYQPIPQSD